MPRFVRTLAALCSRSAQEQAALDAPDVVHGAVHPCWCVTHGDGKRWCDRVEAEASCFGRARVETATSNGVRRVDVKPVHWLTVSSEARLAEDHLSRRLDPAVGGSAPDEVAKHHPMPLR